MSTKPAQPNMTEDEMLASWLDDPELHTEYDSVAEDYDLLDQMLTARQSAGLTQTQVAEHMGVKVTAIIKMESNLASGQSGPSYSTLKKFAKAVGKTLQIRFV
ncbi:helix-turn-helix domain-containing protein [Salmonella enterica]|uniref:Transcriptional regulator n=1 Tax=Salmonella enterica subsp. salamae TaxID=59202 RepID=A0A5Y3XFC4_SALER|nr:helix-turn-helix transcriptional regulator [Salmonella enterica]ECE5745657.1 transcriptional regulator [Salmonella enterica subsp. salamae]EHD0026314.1 helix-turn-helix domain-containing protein [Salmonella enterica subsp. houtenae serovar 50:g,z51:-]HCM1964617.1 helix-turn-helix domain-containing protein [Salmonella enterica subsp. salamae serovar 56:l,v:z39]HEB6532392.1 helix-turn-helix domain-containing protein [Salmonella enterica subsp. enterica serovar Havana]EAM5884817.1 helix-turn-h